MLMYVCCGVEVEGEGKVNVESSPNWYRTARKRRCKPKSLPISSLDKIGDQLLETCSNYAAFGCGGDMRHSIEAAAADDMPRLVSASLHCQ